MATVTEHPIITRAVDRLCEAYPKIQEKETVEIYELHELAIRENWASTEVHLTEDRMWQTTKVEGFGIAPVSVNGALCIGLYAVVVNYPPSADGRDRGGWHRTNTAIETLWPWDALQIFEEELL